MAENNNDKEQENKAAEMKKKKCCKKKSIRKTIKILFNNLSFCNKAVFIK